MYQVRETEAYSNWFEALKDTQARAKILVRVRRLSLGNAGDSGPVGSGVSEMRIHYGPGYRVYFIKRGKGVFLLLGGGDKGSQKQDIRAAIKAAQSGRKGE